MKEMKFFFQHIVKDGVVSALQRSAIIDNYVALSERTGLSENCKFTQSGSAWDLSYILSERDKAYRKFVYLFAQSIINEATGLCRVFNCQKCNTSTGAQSRHSMIRIMKIYDNKDTYNDSSDKEELDSEINYTKRQLELKPISNISSPLTLNISNVSSTTQISFSTPIINETSSNNMNSTNDS